MRKLFILAGILAILGAAAHAQFPGRRYVRANGEAAVSVKPDLLKLTAGVVTQGVTAQEAADQNATQVTSVLTKLRQVLGPNADIKTTSYSLSPNYRYPQGGGQPVLTGYTASNNVEITTSDLSLAGRLIDAAVSGGATNVQGLRFTLKDFEPPRAQALRLATIQAKNHAEAIALGLGVKLGAVLSAQEGTAVRATTLDVRAEAGGGSVPTPVETGMVEVQATVVLDVEIVP